MTLYSPFDPANLPMPHPLLYTSTRLFPLRPYPNAVLALMLRPPINCKVHPNPRWLIIPPKKTSNASDPAKPGDSKDPTSKQQDAESSSTVTNDPRIVFGETEFRTLRQKYNMPKFVSSPSSVIG
jgi:hypothetical protein